MKNFYIVFLLFIFNITFQGLYSQGETCQNAESVSPGIITANGPSSGDGCYNCSSGSSGGIPAENADWYTYSPSESGIIDISTCNGGADTRVWVYEGSCDNLELIASSDDACDFVSGQPYAAAVTNLTVESGKNYFIEFDDAWDISGFDFEFNFTKITTNVFIEGYEFNFTQIPENQLSGNGIPLSFTVGKQGATSQSGIYVITEIFDNNSPGTPVRTFTSPTFDLPNDPLTIALGELKNLPISEYFLIQTVFPNGTDEIPEDNKDTSRIFSVTERSFAIDIDSFVGGMGINGPGKIRMGQLIHFPYPDEIKSVSFNFTGGNPRDSVWAEVYEYNTLTGNPTNLLTQSKKVALAANDPEWFEIPLEDNFIIQNPNSTYFISLTHLASGSSIDLGASEEIFNIQQTWISIEEDPWIPIESINNGAFPYTLAIRPNNKALLKEFIVQVDMSNEAVSGDGVYVGYQINEKIPAEFKQMTDAGNGIWQSEINVPLFSDVQYIFVNGRPDDGGVFEDVPTACSVPNMNQLWRTGSIRHSDKTNSPVCFSHCGICPIQSCDDPMYIICDDFEEYNLGNINSQSSFWTTWNTDSGEGIVTVENAESGTKSMVIDGTDTPAQDILLLLNDVTAGAYELKWNQFIPSDKAAYFGIMHQNPDDDIAGHGFYFDPGGTGEVYIGNDLIQTFQFPENQWFEILLKVHFNNNYATLSIDGTEVAYLRFSDAADIDGNPLPAVNQLAAVNFYPVDDTYKWFVDDVYYREIDEMPDNNVCFDAKDISFLLHADSTLQDNNNEYSSELSDPTNGFECFSEPNGTGTAPDISDTKWYRFIGDGKTYFIRTEGCTNIGTITPANPQIALYSGECNNLNSIECDDKLNRPEEILFHSEQGVEYFLMIDGEDDSKGGFCITIEEAIEVSFNLNMKSFLKSGNSISSEGLKLEYLDDLNFHNRISFTTNQDSIYSVTQHFSIYRPSIEHLFLNGDDYESTDSLSDCGNGLERISHLMGRDTSLPVVCWGKCKDCDNTVSAHTLFVEGNIQIFPNPADNILNINFENISNDRIDFTLFNQLGQVVYFENSQDRIIQKRINLSTRNSGIYILQIKNNTGEFYKKIIVQ